MWRLSVELYRSLQRLRERDGDPLVLPAHDHGSPDPPVTARLSEVEQRNDDPMQDRYAIVEELASDVPEHPPNFQRIKRVNIGRESGDGRDPTALEQGPNRWAAK